MSNAVQVGSKPCFKNNSNSHSVRSQNFIKALYTHSIQALLMPTYITAAAKQFNLGSFRKRLVS